MSLRFRNYWNWMKKFEYMKVAHDARVMRDTYNNLICSNNRNEHFSRTSQPVELINNRT